MVDSRAVPSTPPDEETCWMDTVFDIGMYDGADTKYYLESGYRVVAVEANPNLVAMAQQQFARYIETGALKVLGFAVGTSGGTLELTVCGADPGASSIFADRIAERFPLGVYRVPAKSLNDLIAEHGKPKFIKIDIEGADKMCVVSLKTDLAPQYLSFEAHEDLEEMVLHAQSIGYRHFKIIHQTNFLCLQKQGRFRDRLVYKLITMMGYAEPLLVRRAGRFFRVGHSSGPAPWESDGAWHTADEIIGAWMRATNAVQTTGWYDVHASLD
jgi:FkbM family methyltransferase